MQAKIQNFRNGLKNKKQIVPLCKSSEVIQRMKNSLNNLEERVLLNPTKFYNKVETLIEDTVNEIGGLKENPSTDDRISINIKELRNKRKGLESGLSNQSLLMTKWK